MRRLFTLLFSVPLLLVFSIGCTSHAVIALPPDLPHQAQTDLNASVALIHDFGPRDLKHGAFCSGVWVSPTTIMTAGHCVVGYSHMRHRVQVVEALKEMGVPPVIGTLVLQMPLDQLDINDPEMPPMLRDIIVAIRALPPAEPALGLDMPYIVPAEVRDVGLASTGFQHSTAVYVNEKADVALLQVKGFMPEHSFVFLAEQTPAVGEDVTLVGNIDGNFFSFRKEQVSAYRHSEKYDGMKDIDGPFMQLSGALVSMGDSGSGVFNTQGQLVGLASFVGEVQLSYCIHLETLREVMIGQRMIKAKIDPQAQDPKLGDKDVENLNLQ